MDATTISKQAEIDHLLYQADECRKQADKARMADAKAGWMGQAAKHQRKAERLAKAKN
jgi:hypothetical protein